VGPSVLLVIPARLKSTRLPEKVLLKETGKYLVQHVYERACRVRGADEVLVATDHPRIAEAVASFGGRALMTSPDHASGSDRAAEIARSRPDVRLVVNVQADEPELDPADVEGLIGGMGEARMGTLVHEGLTPEEQGDPSVVKAVVSGDGFAIDFRREPTPGGLRHLGVYAFTREYLLRYASLPPAALERERRLEQMRALADGVAIRAVRARTKGFGIDTPADYAAFVARRRGEPA